MWRKVSLKEWLVLSEVLQWKNWQKLGLTKHEPLGKHHGEFEFPEFIFIQMIAESAGGGRARMFAQLKSDKWIKFIVLEFDIRKEYPCRSSWQELRENT